MGNTQMPDRAGCPQVCGRRSDLPLLRGGRLTRGSGANRLQNRPGPGPFCIS